MRRLLSILLLAVIGMAPVSPLFASTAKSTGLHACCLKNGKHQCAGDTLISSQSPAFSAPAGKCPYSPAAVVKAHSDASALAAQQSTRVSLASQTAIAPQTQSRLEFAAVSQQRKRGPPASFYL